MRAIASFQRYTGSLNFINGPISRVLGCSEVKRHFYHYKPIKVSPLCSEQPKLLTSCLTAVKKHVIKYCEKVYERSGKNLFWSIKNSGEILDKLKARDFNATSLSTYDFSTLYTTLPHNLIKDKLIDLIESTFQREKALLTLHVVTEMHFLLQKNLKNIMHGRVKMYAMR